MRKFDFVPEELSQLTQELYDAQEAYDQALITYDTLQDNEEELLAVIMNEFDDGDITEQKLKRKARATQRWTDFKAGLKAAKDKKIQLSSELKYKKNCYNTAERGLVYRREEMKRNLG